MAESIEGSVAVEEKKLEVVECDNVEAEIKNLTEQAPCSSESPVDPGNPNEQEGGVEGGGVAVDQIASVADDKVVPDVTAEESLPKENLPVISSDEVTTAPSTNDVITETPVTVQISTEVAEDSSQQSSKKRKPEDDEVCGDETKKLKTEEKLAAEETIESTVAAKQSNEEIKESAEEAMQSNEEIKESAEEGIQSVPEEKVVSKDPEEMDAGVVSATAENDIPDENKVKLVEDESPAVSQQAIIEPENAERDMEEDKDSSEKDSSENKENVIEETISNGTTEKEAGKTFEPVDEEAVKIPAGKTLDETETSKEAETVSS